MAFSVRCPTTHLVLSQNFVQLNNHVRSRMGMEQLPRARAFTVLTGTFLECPGTLHNNSGQCSLTSHCNDTMGMD
jgi:hypothetical protein